MVQLVFLHLKLYKRQVQERRRDIYKKQPITSIQNKFLKTKTLFSDQDLDQDIRVFDDGMRADNCYITVMWKTVVLPYFCTCRG